MGDVLRRFILLRTGVFDLLTENETRIGKILSIEWLGQTLASLCWIISVFVYGIEGPGDWLQLGAASFWMVSNLSTILVIK